MKRKYGILHTMALGKKSGVGGVQKVIINSAESLGIKGDVEIIQHIDNEGIKNTADEKSLKVKKIAFEIPTLNNDYGGTSFPKTVIRVLKIMLSLMKLKFLNRKIEYKLILGHDITTLFFMHIFNADYKILMLHTERFYESKTAQFLIKYWPLNKDLIYISPSTNIKRAIENTVPDCNSFLVHTPVFDTVNMKIDMSQFINKTKRYSSSSMSLRLCYVGRFSPMKNMIDMVKFVDELNNLNIDAILDIYGEPFNSDQSKYRDLLIERIASLKNYRKINLRGLTSNPVETFGDYDFSIIFSDGEAIALAGLESFVAGTPVIGYDVGGINELVGIEKRGLLIEKGLVEEGAKNFKKYLNRFNGTETYKQMEEFVNLFTFDSFQKKVNSLVNKD